MIKILYSFFLLVFFPHTLCSQQKNGYPDAVTIPEASCGSIDELSAYIKLNFLTDTGQITAIYVWMANNISYDLARMQAVKNNLQRMPQTAKDVLKMRTAVCQGYSDLFSALCTSLGIKTVVVPGYVKIAGAIMPMAHAWVAAELGGEWFLFDPTWGSGYVADNHFVKQFNNIFCKQSPKDFILTHMPFDPIFQFLSSPKNNREFIDDASAGAKILFNYKDSVNQYSQLSSTEQMTAALRRIETAGIENDLLLEQVQYLKNGIQLYTSKNAFDESNIIFSKAVTLLNQYFAKKNKQFSTVADADLRQMVDSMHHYTKLARSLLSMAVVQNDEQQSAKTNNLNNIDQYWKQLNLEDQFVQKYLTADKALRIELFRR